MSARRMTCIKARKKHKGRTALRRWDRTEVLAQHEPKQAPTCSSAGCKDKPEIGGLCRYHEHWERLDAEYEKARQLRFLLWRQRKGNWSRSIEDMERDEEDRYEQSRACDRGYCGHAECQERLSRYVRS